MIDSTLHAPTSEKHTKRMEPFAKIPAIVEFVNHSLKSYFDNNDCFEKDKSGISFYDIKESWYLFTVLAYSGKVEHTVLHIVKTMLKSKSADLSIARRILNLCKNPIYQKQIELIETYFEKNNQSTDVYKWMNSLQVIPPTSFTWEFVFQLQAGPTEAGNNDMTDNLFLAVRGFEPKGNGESFQIDLSDRDRNTSSRWNDSSKENYIYFKGNKLNLSLVPNIKNLKEFMNELEIIFKLEFCRKYDFQYFTRGFKNKNNIQKWILKN